MRKLKQMLAMTIGVLAALADFGARAMNVATAIVIGAVMTLAARLAFSAADPGAIDARADDIGAA